MAKQDPFAGMKPSEAVQAFLDWLSEMKDVQEKAHEDAMAEDGDKVVDFLHEIEFESSSKKRSVIATRMHESRKKRRVAKDTATALKPIRDFVSDATNRGFIKRLKQLQMNLKSQEDYVASERVYKPRAKEE